MAPPWTSGASPRRPSERPSGSPRTSAGSCGCSPIASRCPTPPTSRGASYDSLDLIADLAGVHDDERLRWYRVAEAIPLTDRHAHHIIDKLKRRATPSAFLFIPIWR